MNNITLMGRMVADAELKSTPSGTAVTSFCVATEPNYKKKGESDAYWIDCVAWRNTAEFISKHFRKGDLIAIQGELTTRTFKDKNGNNRKAVEVVASNAFFCGGKKQAEETPDVAGDDEDDYPF